MSAVLSYVIDPFAILEAAPDALIIVDTNGCINLINKQTENLFGYSKEQLIGQKIEFLIPERYRIKHEGHRAGYFKQPRTRPMGAGLELYGLHQNGHEFPVEISLSPLEIKEGFLALAAVRNISDRKKIEDAQAMLSAIVQSSDDAIIGKDLNGIILAGMRVLNDSMVTPLKK